MKKMLCIFTALWASVSFGATLVPVQLLNPVSSSSGQAIVSAGPGSAPAWGGIGVNGIAAIAANTVLANATASSASPTAFAMPSCSTSASALNWATSTGFTCNTAVNAAQLNGATFAAPGAIGSTTASTGAFTTITSTTSGSGQSILITDTGANGGNLKITGNGGTTPSKTIRANSGQFQVMNNAYSTNILSLTDAGALSVTGSITPSTTGGIIGTTLADNANAGSVGEFVTATSGAVSLTTGAGVNITSISLTAGDWDVWGNVEFDAAASTLMTFLLDGISTTTAVIPASPNRSALAVSFPANATVSLIAPIARINVSTTTTVFLNASAQFTTSTATATGFIRARRHR